MRNERNVRAQEAQGGERPKEVHKLATGHFRGACEHWDIRPSERRPPFSPREFPTSLRTRRRCEARRRVLACCPLSSARCFTCVEQTKCSELRYWLFVRVPALHPSKPSRRRPTPSCSSLYSLLPTRHLKAARRVSGVKNSGSRFQVAALLIVAGLRRLSRAPSRFAAGGGSSHLIGSARERVPSCSRGKDHLMHIEEEEARYERDRPASCCRAPDPRRDACEAEETEA
jgi:hypothetical protein